MRRLSAPTLLSAAVFDECCAAVQSPALATRLLAAANLVAAADADYQEKGAQGTLFSIPSTPGVGDWVDGPEMANLYSGTLARKTSSVRYVYDLLKSAAKHNICPACGQRTVSTLDHYLPQTSHPTLTVVPHNLLPCCADCNKNKLALVPTSASGQTLHPYFDDVDDAVWLVAQVQETTPPAVVFSVSQPSGWEVIKIERVRTHFEVFKLAELYASHAGSELENLQYRLNRVRSAAGPGAVRLHLQEEEAARRHVNRNSWQASMYAALAGSAWFCDVGVTLIDAA